MSLYEQTPRLRQMIRQAREVAEAGKRAAAEQLYAELVAEAPDWATAWAEYGDVLKDEGDKQAAYEKSLMLDGREETALRGLARLRGELVDESDEDKETTVTPILSGGGMTSSARWEEEELVEAEPEVGVVYCQRHPKTRTNLRCYQCGVPICSACAEHTPVGYMCPQCVRQAQSTFYQATGMDYVVAVLIALCGGLVMGILAPLVSFLALYVGAATGTLIGRGIRWSTERRKGRYIHYLVTLCLIGTGVATFLGYLLFFGTILVFLPAEIDNVSLIMFQFQVGSFLYLIFAPLTAYYQLK
ncbi:MAG TPA: hypothetical protein VLL52_15165 [Anaerolineae bacterium]|nr:hypothetical protein [Anaerolineae bacterium]